MNDDSLFFIVIGIIAIAFGVYNLAEKKRNPKRFDKYVETTTRFLGENGSRMWQSLSRIWFPIIVGIISIILVCCF